MAASLETAGDGEIAGASHPDLVGETVMTSRLRELDRER